MMKKQKISVSRMKANCRFAVILGERGSEKKLSDSTRDSFFKGRFFEEVLTNNPNNKDAEYVTWRTRMSDHIRDRIENHARRTRKRLKLSSFNENKYGVWVENDTPDFLLRGEIDLLGKVNVNNTTFGGVIDFKYTKDPAYQWDTGADDLIKFLQVPTYSLSIAYSKGDSDLFHRAIKAYRDSSYTHIPKEIAEWRSGTTVLPGLYVIVDMSSIPGNEVAVRYVQVPAMTNLEIMRLYCQIQDAAHSFGHLDHMDKANDPDTGLWVDANEYKCLGEGSSRSTFCPYLHACKYGKKLLNRVETLSVSNILN